jgi:hypothetical protein
VFSIVKEGFHSLMVIIEESHGRINPFKVIPVGCNPLGCVVGWRLGKGFLLPCKKLPEFRKTAFDLSE